MFGLSECAQFESRWATCQWGKYDTSMSCKPPADHCDHEKHRENEGILLPASMIKTSKKPTHKCKPFSFFFKFSFILFHFICFFLHFINISLNFAAGGTVQLLAHHQAAMIKIANQFHAVNQTIY